MELFCLGRHTVTQTLRSLGAIDADWSAWYRLFSRPRFDEAAAGRFVLQETLAHVPEEEPYVITSDTRSALDPTKEPNFSLCHLCAAEASAVRYG